MAPVTKFAIVVLVLVCGAVVYGVLAPPSEPTATVRIDVIGRPSPRTIVVDSGECDSITVVADLSLSHAMCAVPVGKRIFTVKCGVQTLPDATLAHWIPEGTSHYIQFEQPCAVSAAEVYEANAASATLPGSQWPPSRR